jgi:hypothetical protein
MALARDLDLGETLEGQGVFLAPPGRIELSVSALPNRPDAFLVCEELRNH